MLILQMYLAHTVKRCTLGALRNLHVTSLTAMPNTCTFHTSASLKAADAPPFSSLHGLLDPALLKGLDNMGYEYMTPVQSRVLKSLRHLRNDW